jgi:hypothetical protein
VKRLQEIYTKCVAASQTPAGSAEVRKIYEGVMARHPNATPAYLGSEGMYEFNLRHGYGRELCEVLAKMDAYIPTGHNPTIKTLSAILARESPDAFIDAYLNTACQVRNPVSDIPEAKQVTTGDDDKILTTLNKAFDSANPQPVAITYCASMLIEKRPYSAREKVFDDLTKKNLLGCKQTDLWHNGQVIHQEHTSVLLGRRKNPKTGECEFLLRNTWGFGCDSYSMLESKWDCENTSDLWISQSELVHNTYSYTMFKTEF